MPIRNRKKVAGDTGSLSDMEPEETNEEAAPLHLSDGDKTPLLSETPEEEPAGKKAMSEATVSKLGLFSLAGFLIVIFQVTCEVGKQLSNYSIQYYNGGKYPLPQTLLVVTVELLKLLATISRSKCELPSFSSDNLRRSIRFVLPSILYALNNNIYFAGLILVPPPIWLILCSFRTVVTASIYKFVLKRDITFFQFVGALLIVASIVLAKIGDVMSSSNVNTIPAMAVVLAIIASCNSVGAAVYTESLFKSGGEKFLDQQFWLYLYGCIVATAVHVISATNLGTLEALNNLSSVSVLVQVLLCLALMFSSVGGLVVAAILKMLDNIVKEYSAATANVVTAVACSFLFPEKFEFTVYILISMVFLLSGIYLYETKKSKPASLPVLVAEKSAAGKQGATN